MGIDPVAKPAVFLDRDGVLNPTILNPGTGRMESPLSAHDFRLFDDVLEALFSLQQEGFPLILVSNQPNYALGKSSLETLGEIHQKLVEELLRSGIGFARFCYCLHHPKGVTPGYSGLCVCRKPSPWFLLRARDDFGFTLPDCWLIGDQPTDVQCGKAAGVRTIQMHPAESDIGPRSGPRPDYLARNFSEAAQIVLRHPAL